MEARDVGRRDHGFGYDEHLMLGRDDAAMTDHKQLVPAPAADALGITVIIEVYDDDRPARSGGRWVPVRHAPLFPEDRGCCAPPGGCCPELGTAAGTGLTNRRPLSFR